MSFGQQPVQADDGKAGFVGEMANFGPLLRRDGVGVGREREGSDLDPGVATLAREGKRAVVRPVEKRFVADGEAHVQMFRCSGVQVFRARSGIPEHLNTCYSESGSLTAWPVRAD